MKKPWEEITGIDDSENKYLFFSSICSHCKNLSDFSEDKIPFCRAFDIIPDDIWFGKNDHTKPVKGDNGIMFEPVNIVRVENEK